MEIQMFTLQVEGYRVFRDRVDLEIRPLTLIYGRNQAGKSTLLRLLPALGDSVFGNVPVFDLSSPSLMGASFKELGWLGPQPSGSPSIRMEANNSYVEIQLVDERGVVPNRVRIGSGNGKVDYLDVYLASEPARAEGFSAQYAGKVGSDKEWGGEISFLSMLPKGPNTTALRKIDSVREGLHSLKRVQWISASGSGHLENARKARCGQPNGLDLPLILNGRKDVLDLASEWLSAPETLGESVSIGQDASGTLRLELRRSGNEALPNHLAGEGAQFLLPILLYACWAELDKNSGPSMLAVEEPEARLHPNLQISIFERLLKTIASGVPCVMETHSIYLLRRAQMAVLKGEISSEDLAIYWVERNGHAASVKKIRLDSSAALLGWNPETFEEEQKISREIFELRWRSLEGG
ncbi:hypothetical protein C8246_13855 [Paracidovorax avenae]|nr:hypothetical protein C8246_13855 [Paracidovorax avenae]